MEMQISIIHLHKCEIFSIINTEREQGVSSAKAVAVYLSREQTNNVFFFIWDNAKVKHPGNYPCYGNAL